MSEGVLRRMNVLSLILLSTVLLLSPLIMSQRAHGFGEVVYNEHITETWDGSELNGASTYLSVSEDGRLVAFVSYASNIVEGDTNGISDVFVRDRNTQTTIRVSVWSDGSQASGGQSFTSKISADGRYVAFGTDASIDYRDNNTDSDVYRHDMLTGITELVSASLQNDSSNGGVNGIDISADGSIVAFTSRASNLVTSDNNNVSDVFVRDMNTGVTELVSVSTAGVQATVHTVWLTGMSGDGNLISFATKANEIDINDNNVLGYDVFLRDREAGTTALAGVTDQGAQGDDSTYGGTISLDGKYLFYESRSSDIISGAMQDGTFHTYSRNLATESVETVSLDSSGAPTFGGTSSVSSDGNRAVLGGLLDINHPDNTSALRDTYVRDRTTGELEMAVLTHDGLQAVGTKSSIQISGNGNTLVYRGGDVNILPGLPSTNFIIARDFVEYVAPVDTCNGLEPTIVGTDGDDVIIGTDGDDVIMGFGGNDVIKGKKGNDVICGGDGNDELRGNRGMDIIFGGSGDDYIYGGRAADVLHGGDGNDYMYGRRGADTLYGDAGDDVLRGNRGIDSLHGGGGDDLFGNRGNDSLDGGADVNSATGGRGEDTCVNSAAVATCEL